MNGAALCEREVWKVAESRSVHTLRPRRLTGCRLSSCGLALTLLTISVTSVGGEQSSPVAFVNAIVETLSGETIESGTVLVRGTKIEAVGTDVELPRDAKQIDATGKVIMPGLVVPWSTLGLSGAPGGKPGNFADARIAKELYPPQDAYRRALLAGCTTLCLVPGGQGISGQAAVCRPLAETAEDMPLSWWGPLVINFYPSTQCKQAIRGALDAAKKLLKDGEVPKGLNDRDEALCRALTGEKPTLVNVGGEGAVLHALPFFQGWEKLDLTLVCSGTAYLLAKELAEAKHRVLMPTDIIYAPQTRNRVNPFRVLHEAGVPLVARPRSDSPTGMREVWLHLAQLVKSGLPREVALKAVTLSAAEALGMDYRLGSLEPGKDANLLVLSGDPLSPTTQIERVVLEGETVFGVGGEDE